MIQAVYQEHSFEINEGEFIGNLPALASFFNREVEFDFPGPSEGDPDYVLFQRLKQQFPDIILVKYIPMEIDPDVVY